MVMIKSKVICKAQKGNKYIKDWHEESFLHFENLSKSFPF